MLPNETRTNARTRASGNGTPKRPITVERINPPAMANTPWARLTNPIRPIVTDRPTEMTYKIMPKATPWKATLTREERNSCRVLLLLRRLLQFLPRILHRGANGLELDVGELPADLAHLAQILGLDDVARLRVDRDRAARAVRVLPALGDFHRA